MRTFVVDEVGSEHVTEKYKATRYVMSKELINLYDKINKTGLFENIQLMIQGIPYDITLNAFLVQNKNFKGERIVLKFPLLDDSGTITHFQYKQNKNPLKTTFVITEDQKTYPHGDANEIQIKMPEELNELYQSLSQKGRGLTIPINLEIDDQSFNFELHPHQSLYHETLESDEANIHITLQFQEKGHDWDSGILIRKFPKLEESVRKKKQKNHRTYEDYQKEYDLLSYMFGFSQVYIQQSENLALKEYQKDMGDLYQKYVSRLQKKCLKNTGKELNRK